MTHQARIPPGGHLMPDRTIAATALHLGLPLISRDRKIQLAGLQMIW